MSNQKRHKVEFGDFQTPINLARQVCALVAQSGVRPTSVLEPTCGTGSFLQATLQTLPYVSHVLGFEINLEYVEWARRVVLPVAASNIQVEIRHSDFFLTEWSRVIDKLPEPLLVIGNPPWVTNTELSTLGSNNVPAKSNLGNLRGIEALTGKSNFDISEWMLRKNVEWLNSKHGLLAMLCKTTVARKVLLYAWTNELTTASASLYHLDAQKHFGAAVDACLLLIKTHPVSQNRECRVYDSLQAKSPTDTFGLRDGKLVADTQLYEKWKGLSGIGLKGWRSGIKHDASKVFELRFANDKLVNGFGEYVDIESDVLFPLLKSSDLAAHRDPRRWLIVPQRTTGEDTRQLKINAPRTWDYLVAHTQLLDKRGSIIYKNRPRFSIFGIGPYSFAPWKVAISGLYKKLDFAQVGPFQGLPVVFDDTCYFFSCSSEEECCVLYELLTSRPAQEFFSAFIFWDSKRPITARLLNLLDLTVLAQVLGKEVRFTMNGQRQAAK